MAYTCPVCQKVSHNPHDEAERYCGRCHRYEDDRKNARLLAELVAEASCMCSRGRCCPVHKTHVSPHVGCVLR